MSLISFKIIFQCVSWRDKLEKERTRLGPKSDFFFGVRNWMCGVRACENMQKRVTRRNRESWQLTVKHFGTFQNKGCIDDAYY